MIKQILRKLINKQLRKNADKLEKAKNKAPFLKKYITATPESLQRGKNNWKIIKKRVMLLTDGVKIGLCELIIPHEHHLKQNIKKANEDVYFMNEENNLQIERRGSKKKSKLAMFATIAASEKENITDQDKKDKQMAEKMAQLEKMLEEDRKAHANNEQELNDYKNDPENVWDGKKISSLDLLTGKIDPKLLEFLEEKVKKYQIKQEEQFARDKIIFRNYFAQELNWEEIKRIKDQERQAKIDKRQSSKAKKMAKKTKKEYEECLQIVKDEEAEEERKKKEKELEKEGKGKVNIQQVVPEANGTQDGEDLEKKKQPIDNQFYTDSQQLVVDQKEEDIPEDQKSKN